jgi:hypothetical protein
MAGRKVARYVTTPDETGRMVTYAPGDTLPDEVAERVTNPKAWEADEEESGAEEAAAAPRRRSRSRS